MTAIRQQNALSHFSTLSGTSNDVRTQLADMSSRRVIAFAFEPGNELDVSELVDVINNIAFVINSVKMQHQTRQNKAFQAVIEALIVPVPLPHHKLVEAQMTARAHNAVFESGEWLTAAQLAEMAGFSKKNPSAQPNKWKKEGLIFAVKQNGIDYFPAYGLDPATKYRPYKVLADVIHVFGNKKDAWGLAYWFSSVNSFLGGARPQDILAKNPENVIAAAKDEAADLGGVAHG